jgi:putative membrane protein
VTLNDIPPINAGLNALATVLISAGFIFIKSGHKNAHRACMVSAGVVSAVFLVGYVAHKILKGMAAGAGEAVHTKFGGTGAIATVYYVMLISHILLAISIAYLVPKTFSLAFKGDFERHKKWAKVVFPIWYYVSVTGVLVYFFLYQWWPAAQPAMH